MEVVRDCMTHEEAFNLLVAGIEGVAGRILYQIIELRTGAGRMSRSEDNVTTLTSVLSSLSYHCEVLRELGVSGDCLDPALESKVREASAQAQACIVPLPNTGGDGLGGPVG